MAYIKDAISEFITKSGGVNPKAVAGFDGFIDTLVRTVKKRSDDDVEYFNDIKEFGEFLIGRAGKSCLISLDPTVRKLGGNSPICAYAMSKLGANVELIGAIGYPVPDELFAAMEGIKLHSVANAGATLALEFKDGKVMLCNSISVQEVSWARIKDLIGIDKLVEIYEGAGIVGMFNWADMRNATEIWRGVCEDIMPKVKLAPNAVVSVDLADCARRSDEEIREIIDVLRGFKKYCKVILNVNFNEYRQVFTAITGKEAPENIEESNLLSVTELDVVCVHVHDGSTAFDTNGSATVKTYFIDNPKISTGGGDNYNAGFTSAVYHGLNMQDSLIVANAVSGFYIKNGYSATPNELLGHADEWEKHLSL